MASSEDRMQTVDAEAFDAELRRTLEPNPAVVERLVHSALDGERPARNATWRLAAMTAPAAAAVALVALIAAALIPSLTFVPSDAESAPAPMAPTTLRISNEDGAVTVTTPAGSKMIILPGDLS